VEAQLAPFSARSVAAMNLRTDSGTPSVKQVCAIFQFSRAAWYAAQKARRENDAPASPSGPSEPKAPRFASVEALLPAIRRIVDHHPAWGVRKVWATIRRAPYGLKVSQKRVWALMTAHGLTLTANASRRAAPLRGQVVTPEPNRRWATDLTTVHTKVDGVVAVVPVVDCGCRSVLAIGVSKAQTSTAVLAPLREALQEAFGRPEDVPDGLELRTDHGPQYTGADCHDLAEQWRLDHTFAPVGRPTGNAVAERTIRTLKEECVWLQDWNDIEELRAALSAWQHSFNAERPHQSLGWQTPTERREERLGGAILAAA
jgi:putative transposase